MTGLLVAGTSSDAGKSLIVAGLCRAARRRGIRVTPFKAQNMSNNSMVCLDGSEIGRAQYLQAMAAGITPSSLLNPVLLKPGSDRRSFIVLRGQPHGTLEAGEYSTGRRALAEAAHAAYRELAADHDLVICEGAGSPAEINLRDGDYTNMGLAQAFDLPVLIVGDIDRGGVLASIFGTWGLLDDADRALLAGYLINKFRGDQAVLDPGLAELTRRTGLPSFGVVPWVPVMWVDGEDALEVGRWRGEERGEPRLTVAVVRLPRISNATDVDALAHEPGVNVVVTVDPEAVAAADLAVVPGSRSTLNDLAWLRSTGIADALTRRAAAGRPVLGICGGFQMLTRTISDPVEAGQTDPVDGLALLPADVHFSPDKVLGRTQGTWRGELAEGYVIHHGRVTVDPGQEPFLDGVTVGAVYGTMWHGAFESDAFRRRFLAEVADTVGATWAPGVDAGFGARREAMIDAIADALEAHTDVDAILALAR